MNGVDLAIGVPSKLLQARVAVDADSAPPASLAGTVAACVRTNIELWLPALADRTAVKEAVVVLPALTGAAWFKHLEQGEWVCCFLQKVEPPLVVCYHGERKYGFSLVFGELGTMLVGGQS